MDYHCVLFCSIEKDGEAVYSKLNVDKFIVSAKNMYDSRKIAKYQLPVNLLTERLMCIYMPDILKSII